MKAVALTALVALLPLTATAQTSAIMYVPRSDRMIAHLYVQTGTTVDIALPPGESLSSNPIIGDPRWRMVTFASGNVVHIALKPSDVLPHDQLLTIPSSKRALHLLVSAGANPSTTYTIQFFEPEPRPPANARRGAPAPAPTPPGPVRVGSCAAPLDTRYAIVGDRRIDVRAACDDGHHTFLLVGDGPDAPSAVPYRVDAAGHQDLIANATFAPADATHPGQWVLDGVADRWALVVDSSRGQMRKEIDRR
jgi:type IV secretory pathway VirB9-like protein